MIYLDNAATSYHKPKEVIDGMMQALEGMGNAGRGVNDASLGASRIAYETRCRLSELFGGYGPSQTVFTMNSTEALNMAIAGTLSPEDHVITTEMEHNSVLRPLYRLEDQGMTLDILKVDEKGRVDYEDFVYHIRGNTRAIVCTHCSNLTGNLVDIGRIGKLAREKGLLFIVDASQTAGVFPIDMKAMNIDILCLTGHKSLMGPQGTGALLVREGVEIVAFKVGGSGIHTYDRKHPEEMPTRLEAGTLNMHGIAGLLGALKHLEKVGIREIREKEQALAKRFYDGILDVKDIKIYGDFSAGDRAPIVSVNLGEYGSGEVSDALLMDYGIQTRSGGHCAPLMHKALGTVEQGAVRFSFNWFNTAEEVDVAIRALHELA